MELGVQGLNAKATLSPAVTPRIARRAEELGYTSWWAGEHVVLPSPRTPGSPMDPKDPVLDPLVHPARRSRLCPAVPGTARRTPPLTAVR